MNRVAPASVSLVMQRLKVLSAAAVAVLLAACGSGGADGPAAQPGPASSGGNDYVVKDYSFPPLTVAPGERVRVLDGDDEPHTLTAVDGSFDTGSFDKAEPGEFTAPTKPGTYQIYCRVHPSMRGTLTVR